MNVQYDLVAMPSFLKLGSMISPQQFQASEMAEKAILSLCTATHVLEMALREARRLGSPDWVVFALGQLGWAASVLMFLVVDLLVGVTFILGQCIPSTIGLWRVLMEMGMGIGM
jgi:hypothetical protein